MTAIYNLAPGGDNSAQLSAINTNIDDVETRLGAASASPGANSINANLVRNVKSSAQCSSAATAPTATTAVAASGTTTGLTIVNAAPAGVDWRRVSIYNSGSLPIFISVGGTVSGTVYTMPMPPGLFLSFNTLLAITAISSGVATAVLVTIET